MQIVRLHSIIEMKSDVPNNPFYLTYVSINRELVYLEEPVFIFEMNVIEFTKHS